MAKSVFSVMGVTIETNLTIDSIDGPRVVFTDGSSCNVATNNIRVIGDGAYITMRSGPTPQTVQEERKTREMKFPALPLVVNDLYANLVIAGYDGKEIEVKIEGTESEIGAISAKEDSDKIIIGGGNVDGGFSSILQLSNVVSIGKLVVQQILGGVGTDNPGPKVSINVPIGTDVTLSGIHFPAEIGDTLGNLDLTVDSDDDVSVGSVKECNIRIEDDGDLSIKEVEGDLKIVVDGDGNTTIDTVNGAIDCEINDDGDVTIKNGVVSLLKIRSDGDGDFVFKGNAKDSILIANDDGDIIISQSSGSTEIGSYGDGDVYVETANGVLTVKIDDDGDAVIKNGDLSNLTATLTDSAYGSFEFKGVTNGETHIANNGDGTTHLVEVNGKLLSIINSGDGDCIVDRGSVETLNIAVGDDGNVSFRGRATYATLSTTGDGDINVGFVENRPTTKIRGDGDINIKNWHVD